MMDAEAQLGWIMDSLIFLKEKVLLNKLQGLVAKIKWSPTDVEDLFVALLERFDLGNSDRGHLLQWLLEMLHLIEVYFITPSWKHLGRTAVELVRDTAVTDSTLKDYFSKEEEKKLGEIIEEIRQTNFNQVDATLLRDVEDIVSSVSEALLSKTPANLSGIKGDLLRLCRAAEEVHFHPRLTQMVSWCIMALSKTGRFIQVSTGEGKSCTVAMFAAYRAMKGEKVHILTSSPVLAERDKNEWQAFYGKLDVKVDCNTNKQNAECLQVCYKSQVVYGTPEKFAGDWLTQRFERTDIFGQAAFQCAIVDEEDSILLDKALHVIYISSEMPALQHLNSLLAFIWATVNQYSNIDGKTTAGPKDSFFQVALNLTKDKDLQQPTIVQMAEEAGVLPKGSTMVLGQDPQRFTNKTTNATVSQLAKFFTMLEEKLPSFQFALHGQNSDGSLEQLNSPHREGSISLLLLDGGLCRRLYRDDKSVTRAIEEDVKSALHFTPCEVTTDKHYCYVPGFLSGLVTSTLEVWISNALKAQQMTEDHHYVLEGQGIVPVDYSSTGVIENFMKWSDGLHQFLELKHKLRLHNMQPVSNFMSNFGLLQMYKGNIFGLTGTLGQQAERETLQKLYGVETCQIPTFKRKKLFEVEGMIVGEEKDWIETVCNIVSEQIQATSYRGQRAALVICETIDRAKTICSSLKHVEAKKELLISNNMDNKRILDKELKGGDVIIATNLAGRGTDFKVSEQVKAAGGLFVVQTFLPENSRVEAQAFGRTARQGSPGSAQLVVCRSHLLKLLQCLSVLTGLRSFLANALKPRSFVNMFVLMLRDYQRTQCKDTTALRQTLVSILNKDTSNLEINEIKNVRDMVAAQRLVNLLEDDIPNMKVKEDLFQQFLSVRDKIPANSSESQLNEYWAFWLLIKDQDKDPTQSLSEELGKDLNKAIGQLKKGESPFSNLHHYTTTGNKLLEKHNFEQSVQMYTKAIQLDPCWAAFAYYNRAFARLLQQNPQDQNCIRQAIEDLQQAQASVGLYCNQTEFTQRCYKQVECNPEASISRFEHHIKKRQQVFMVLKESIGMALTKLKRVRAMGGSVKVERTLPFLLVPVQDWLIPIVLVASEGRDQLKIYQLMSNPKFDLLYELQCLDSLGLSYIYNLDTVFSFGGFLSKIFSTNG